MTFMYQLPYPPSVNHIYIRTKCGVILDKKAKEYREEVISTIGKGHTTLTGPIKLCIDVFMPDARKRDLDNIFKSLNDALTHAGVWKDDSQIEVISAKKCGIEAPGRVLVSVTQI